MSRVFFTLAFAIGLAITAWIGHGFMGSDLLALAVTLIIAGVFSLGFLELRGFRQQTRQLQHQLAQLPDHSEGLASWLSGLPEPLQIPVQRRLEGYPGSLPTPTLTPYLVGLLVMLGLLGTFAGMIVTLSGAAQALDGSSDLTAIRSALAAPIAGLSLAFGTSIAGVAASAMLGLASALSRKDRLLAARQLDRALRQELYPMSGDYQRQQAFRAITGQAEALPELTAAMTALATRMEQLGDRLERSLISNQEAFHQHFQSTVSEHHRVLAESVATHLRQAIEDSTRLTAERIEPVISTTLAGFAETTRALQQQWAQSTEEQLTRVASQFREHAGTLLGQQQQGIQTLTESVTEQLSALRAQEAERDRVASERLAALEATARKHLTELGAALETPMTRLIETASETPKAAAEVIRQLQSEMTRNTERENELLTERQRLVSELDQLLDTQHRTVDGQRQAIDTLIRGADQALAGISERFSDLIDVQGQQLNLLREELAGGGQELGALSDAFRHSMTLFQSASEAMTSRLGEIQQALDDAGTRHDEQLAYYIAQAREVIDLSLSSQKDVIDAVARLQREQTSTTGTA